jgi:hypothetical protein
VGEEPLMRTGRRVQRSPALCGGEEPTNKGFGRLGARLPCVRVCSLKEMGNMVMAESLETGLVLNKL